MAKKFVQPAKNIQTNCDNLGTLIIKLPLFGLWSKISFVVRIYGKSFLFAYLLTWPGKTCACAMCNERTLALEETAGVHDTYTPKPLLINQFPKNLK